MSNPNPQTQTQNLKYKILDKRISDGYYTYVLELYDNNSLIDYEYYGDMSFWGIPNVVVAYDEALKKLLERNNINENEVEIMSCGGYFQPRCE